MDLTAESNRQPGIIKAKRPGTLDLANTSSKKKKFAAILTSPDLKMLKLTSPELERFIMTNCDATKTPSPTQVFSENVTEQENSTDKCAYAFNELHLRTAKLDISLLGQNTNPNFDNSFNLAISKVYGGLFPLMMTTPAVTNGIKLTGRQNCNVLRAQNPPICPPSIESSSSSSCSLPVSLEFESKETNQTVPLDFSGLLPSTTPIDMADQEIKKREIKRYRNRIAASRCRKRKLEKISQLEAEKKELKEEIDKLEASASNLHKEVNTLKETLLHHMRSGCTVMMHYPS